MNNVDEYETVKAELANKESEWSHEESSTPSISEHRAEEF